jgi:hypothetical protein
MSKQATISSLVRQAAKTETEFQAVILAVFEEADLERAAEFFDRLNVPRSVEGDNFNEPLADLSAGAENVGTYEQERVLGAGIQKYMDRHLKKLKWHAQRPSIDGGRNVLLVMREGMAVTDMRVRRLNNLLKTKDELTPTEWAIARDLMNRAYLSFRHFLVQLGGAWIDACTAALDHEELGELLGNFYELVDLTIRHLEEYRHKIEERRLELTVLPPGYDPVKPPIYFGGDLMGRGPWKQFWSVIEDRSHHFREALA